jgi:hypothetical protein
MGGELVGVAHIVGAEVDSKTPLCSVLGPLDSVRGVFVGVSETIPASVGFDNLPECISVDCFAVTG